MPIQDYDLELTTAGGQAFTGAAAVGTRVKNAGAAKDWGAGTLIFPWVKMTSDADSDVGTSMTFDLIAADDEALNTNPVVLSTVTVLKAALLKSTIHRMPPLKGGVQKQYLGFKFTPTGGNATTGKGKCFLTTESNLAEDGVNYMK